MQIFISGTDTDIGKTTIASWLAVHTGFSYFKPIQTGASDTRDCLSVASLSHVKIYPELLCYQQSISPHLAAAFEGDKIDMQDIFLPTEANLIIEGAGGLLVPLNDKNFMIDLIKKLQVSVILVSSDRLGTINHTLLSLEALNNRNIPILGVVINGSENSRNKNSIEYYGKVKVLAEFPRLEKIDRKTLESIKIPEKFQSILYSKHENF